MCGIAGIVEHRPHAQPDAEALRRMASVLTHRGPDDAGYLVRGRAGLAHRRLSIIDIGGGHQPMSSADGRCSVVFNGEIYNFPDLRAALEREGLTFRTRSDTEVLLELFRREGVAGLSRLNGMFACAFWDAEDDALTLVRDRMGKKPLYYHAGPERFLFGSELKSLLAHGTLTPAVDRRGLLDYLSFGYVAGANCILQGVAKVPPGHFVTLRDGRVDCRPYWSLRFRPDPNPPDEREAEERLEVLLTDAVRRRMISDVPLGAFLSGGLDSSIVVALMARVADRPVRTFSIGFDERGYSELEDARLVAQHLGTEHHETVVRPSALEILPRLIWHLDEPFADSSAVPTFYVCQAARREVTVALSGDGGDEVFAGYQRYLELGRYEAMLRVPQGVRSRLVRPFASRIPFTWPAYNYLYAMGRIGPSPVPHRLGLYPFVLERLLHDDLLAELERTDPHAPTERRLAEVADLDAVSAYQYADTLQYLPDDILVKVDRTSMALSLEVRAPLLDYNVVEYVASLPIEYKLLNGETKRLLRRIAGRLLPPSVLQKRKQGFAIPIAEWFRGELRPLAHDVLLDSRSVNRGIVRAAVVRRMLEHHDAGSRDYSDWIWALLVLELWFRTHLDGVPTTGAPPPLVAASGTTGVSP